MCGVCRTAPRAACLSLPPAIQPRLTLPPAFPLPNPSPPPSRLQLDFLQRHALATSISFGPVSLSDAVAVLNAEPFAQRNAALLHQLHHLEVSSQLNLEPYTGGRSRCAARPLMPSPLGWLTGAGAGRGGPGGAGLLALLRLCRRLPLVLWCIHARAWN